MTSSYPPRITCFPFADFNHGNLSQAKGAVSNNEICMFSQIKYYSLILLKKM